MFVVSAAVNYHTIKSMLQSQNKVVYRLSWLFTLFFKHQKDTFWNRILSSGFSCHSEWNPKSLSWSRRSFLILPLPTSVTSATLCLQSIWFSYTGSLLLWDSCLRTFALTWPTPHPHIHTHRYQHNLLAHCIFHSVQMLTSPRSFP